MFLYTFSICVSPEDDLPVFNLNEEHQDIKFYSFIFLVLYIIGNLYKVGNMFCSFIFYPIEKDYFPAPLKKYYKKSKNNLKIKKERNFLIQRNNFSDEYSEMSELDPFIFDK